MKKIFYTIAALVITTSAFSQDPQGFFLNDATPKNAVIPTSVDEAKPSGEAAATVTVNATNVIAPVSKYVYGHNANVFMTQMYNQPSLITHLNELSPNVIRFPGGNISSVYFWNADPNSPPADAPAKIVDGSTGNEVDPGYWYGKNTADWTCSVDNYYKMLDATNSTGIITVNYGYARYGTGADPVAAAAHLAADWVRYDHGRTKFWEIGNESNGNWQTGWRINTANNHDGQPQIMQGTLYGNHFKVFADSMRKAATEIGSTIYIGAQLLQEAPASWWTDTDKNWNAGVFQKAEDTPDYYIIHSYYTPYNTNSSASDILVSATTVTGNMMTYVTSSIQAAGRAPKPLALTEWNIFAVGSKQMVSYINGMHATLVLAEAIKNKYGMTSRWDLANAYDGGNDHGLFSQGDEPEGNIPRWNPRPAFYYMYYFQKYFGDHMVSATVSGNSDILAYASTFASGESGIVVINKGTTARTVKVNLNNFGFGEKYYWYTLTGGTDNGDFSRKVSVNGKTTTYASGGPANVESIAAKSATIGAGIMLTAPPRSVQYVLVESGDNVITGMSDDLPSLQVYPNPSHGSFRIDLASRGYSSFDIRDSQGKELFNAALSPEQRDAEVNSNFAPGIYFVRLHAKNKLTMARIAIH